MDARARVLKGYRNLEVVAYGLGRQHDNHVSHAIHVLRIIKKNDLFFAHIRSLPSLIRAFPLPHTVDTHTHVDCQRLRATFFVRASAKCRMWLGPERFADIKWHKIELWMFHEMENLILMRLTISLSHLRGTYAVCLRKITDTYYIFPNYFYVIALICVNRGEMMHGRVCVYLSLISPILYSIYFDFNNV